MKNALFVSTVIAAYAMATTGIAQEAQLPTSESAVGSFEVPIVIIPESSIPTGEEVSDVSEGSAVLTLSLNATTISEAVFDFPREQNELLNIISFSAFGGSLDSLSEGSLAADPTTLSLPSVGTATFNGVAVGTVVDGESGGQVNGDVTVDVDFASGAVESAFINMTRQTVTTDGLDAVTGQTAWRDFSSSGSIVDGTALFAGDAATADGLLTGSVSGMIDGTEGVEGLWSLAGDGEAAFGGFQASAE